MPSYISIISFVGRIGCQYIYFADHVHEKARIWSRQNTSDTILFWLNVNTFISQITCKRSQNLVQTQYVWHHSVLTVSCRTAIFAMVLPKLMDKFFPAYLFFFFIFVANNKNLKCKMILLYHRNKLVLVSPINYNCTPSTKSRHLSHYDDRSTWC